MNKVKEETRTEKQSTTTTKSQVKKVIKQTTTEEEEIEEEEEIIEYRVIDNKDGTYNVYYKAIEQGDYKVDLKFGGQPIPNGSFSIKVTLKLLLITFIFILLPLFLHKKLKYNQFHG